MSERAVRESFSERSVVAADDLPIFFRPVLHLVEGGVGLGCLFCTHYECPFGRSKDNTESEQRPPQA